jgi:hypothetical protein
MMPWEKPPVQDSLEIPTCLKRDVNNVAPYMLKTSSQINPSNNPPSSNPNWLPLSEPKT